MRIVLRADSGFCRESIMAWCEENRVDFVLGLARNARLVEEIAANSTRPKYLLDGRARPRLPGLPVSNARQWSRPRRVIGKAEWTRASPIRDSS